ncbi:proline dehydrogenase family protein [Pontibacter anaerobius]|uniref:Proline dehydrogenase family protein n=1 Tax=Pontibacter anaerobius TaxID=2993940 RepID=A0ABT3RCG7_9BACT|nr:proline dehydrogenase family protein [Pontibacter anaerobius]MCX2739544.1 proline dehydrogenase family protein [Pontibacter anaerobius]
MAQTTASLHTPGQFDPDNLQVTFCNKTDSEMKLAYWLFNMMGMPALVKAGGMATILALRLGLPIKPLIRNTLYRHFCGGETVQEAQQVVQKLAAARVQTVLDYAAEAQDTEPGFDAVRDEVLRNIALAGDTRGFSCISVKLTGIGHNSIYEKLHLKQNLSPEEQKAFARTEARLDEICRAAAEADITVYIDAEESWLQNPVDELAEEMMRRYNKERAVVFNTLQMYRTDRVAYLKACLRRFENEPVILGIKIVRGAYLEKEQNRAEAQGYPCPVFTRKADSDKSFNEAIDICLDNLHRVELCAATHNEQSITYLTKRIRQDNISNHRDRIHFSQLYGMSDNLTYNLAAAGYNASKYLPYGDVATAVPYLIRRAEENTSIAGQMGRELVLLQKEMRRRKL